MDSSRWERVQRLFHEALDLAPGAREEYLGRACEGDAALAAEVWAMIEQDRKAAQLLDRPLEEVAQDLLRAPATPGQIGAYRLERVLGEGGMGTVFLGVRADLGSRAAIKVLRDAWISPARRERFGAEQRTLAGLNHPNIAGLLDADMLPDGTPYFVMEYVDGEHLDAYCNRVDAIRETRLKLFLQVCRAVQFAHQQAVIHRDIKPSNILVTSDGVVKLLDFGIARQLESLDREAEATRTAVRFFTPAYASPEQLRGESLGVATDVYSLGAVLRGLLGDQQAGGDLAVVCQKATHEDAARRYSSVEALARDIDHYLAHKPLEARPDRLGYRAGKFLRRNREPVIAAGLVAMGTIALIAVFLIQLRAERNSALGEAARAQRIQRFMLNLFQGGDREAGPAKDLSVATLVERGVKEAQALHDDPAAQAELYRTLGEIHQKLGNLAQAESLFDSALERHAEPATVLALGLLRVDQAKLAEAERLVRQGLAQARATLPAGHPLIADANDALGKVLEEKGEYGAAIAVLDESARMRGKDETGLANSLYELANVHFYAGHYSQSQALNERVLAIRKRVDGEAHPGVAEVLVNLGAVQQELGHYAEAEQFHRKALAIHQAFYGDQHPVTASGLTMVARALVFEKKTDEARGLLLRAVGIQESVFGKAHPRVASALNELGNVAMARNRYEEARAAFTRMVEIYREVYAGKHYLIGIATSNLGNAYLREGENAKAEKLFREALAMFRETLPGEHLNIAIARIKLGRTLLRQKRYAEAKAETSGGFTILNKQVAPSVTWLQSARADLAEIEQGMRRKDAVH